MIKKIKNNYINPQPTTHNPQPNYGFTLIEVLVAATIVALLSTMGVGGYQAVTKNGRDALRKSDLEQIRSALEIYKSEVSDHKYPTASSCQASGLSPGYINPYPADSKSPYQYCYIPSGDRLSYNLCAHLENKSDTDSYCNTSNNCGGSCNYQVTNP